MKMKGGNSTGDSTHILLCCCQHRDNFIGHISELAIIICGTFEFDREKIEIWNNLSSESRLERKK